MKKSKTVHENASLLEVIAEVHWDLRTVDEQAGIRTDPYFYPFQDCFISRAEAKGLSCVEEVTPTFVPIDHSAGKPRVRLRESANTWPVVQFGPGILTANIIPPYSGWADFASFLNTQVDCLYDVYHDLDQTVSINRLSLRYIDGFTEQHGFNRFPEFAAEMLGVENPLSAAFHDNNILEEGRFVYSFNLTFASKEPLHSHGRLMISPGTVKNKEALIMELSCEILTKELLNCRGQIKDWFKQAHSAIERQFDIITTPQLKEVMAKSPS